MSSDNAKKSLLYANAFSILQKSLLSQHCLLESARKLRDECWGNGQLVKLMTKKLSSCKSDDNQNLKLFFNDNNQLAVQQKGGDPHETGNMVLLCFQKGCVIRPLDYQAFCSRHEGDFKQFK